MAVVNQVMVEVFKVVERAAKLEDRDDPTSTMSLLPSTTTSPTSSATTSAASGGGGSGPTSSPLLFFVALGFGVVFTNLWIIVGVKYCFRYNARNRAMRVGGDGEPINLENVPRPHRRRREKKLMSMDEVNERFPLLKYKNWVASRASAGLPTAGGVEAPPSGTLSVGYANATIPDSPNPNRSDRPFNKFGEDSDNSQITRAGASHSDSLQSLTEEKAHIESETSNLPPLEEVKTSTSTVDAKIAAAGEDEEDDEEEHIHTAVPPELMQNPGDSCAICIDTLEDDEDIRGLTCGHAFHAGCLDPWLTSRRACCPLCKADYHVPKQRPEGEAAESEREQRRSRRTDPNNRRMNMPQAPNSTWTAVRGSPFRGPRMILPGRFMTNPMYPGDGYSYAGGAGSERRRRAERSTRDAGAQRGMAGATARSTAEARTAWRPRFHVTNPFSNLRMPAIRLLGRSDASEPANHTPAQLEAGVIYH